MCIHIFIQDDLTALHLAAMHDAKEIVSMLLEYETIDVLAQEKKVFYD